MVRWAILAALSLVTGASEIDRLVADLADDDVEIRNWAMSELVRKGGKARPALEAARLSADVEMRERARLLLKRISPLQILFDFDPERADANQCLNLSIRLINESDEEVVFFCAGVSSRVELLELFDEPRDAMIVFDGRSARRAGCPLSEEDFVRVAAGGGFHRPIPPIHRREVEVSAEVRKAYPGISFWKAETAGRYRVVASYGFDRAAYKSRCTRECPDHDDPRKLWNRCSTQPLENDRSFTLAVGIERCACERR